MTGACLRARRLTRVATRMLALGLWFAFGAPALAQQPIQLADKLASLEVRLASAEAGGGVDLAAIERETHAIVAQSPSTSERIQARRILRRVRRLSDSMTGSPTGAVRQVAHAEYSYAAPSGPVYSSTPSMSVPMATPMTGTPMAGTMSTPMAGSMSTPSGIAPQGAQPPVQRQGLQRLAQMASNLAQYGVPQTDPGCGYAPAPQVYAPAATTITPVPMTAVPMATMGPVPMMAPVPMAVPIAAPATRHYANLDALGWWVKGDSLPALVTSSPLGTPQDQAGVLGQPGTTVLFGNQSVNTNLRWGGRGIGGVWLDPQQTFALEGGYYGLTTQTTTFEANSDFSADPNSTILARPFFDTNPAVNAQSAQLVAFPDYVIPIILPPPFDLDGTIDIQEKSFIQSAMGGVRYGIGPYNSPGRIFLVAGYRFWQLQESLAIATTRQTVLEPFPTDAAFILQTDSFSTNNVFNGGEIGIGTELKRNDWSLGAETRLGMGNMNQQVSIAGMTAAVYDTYAAGYVGGLLAQPTNIGTFTQNKFALIPSVDVKLGYQLFRCLRVTGGYNFTYVSSVARPGGQIDTNVNSSQFAGQPLVGPANPVAQIDTTSIWLQGFTIGGDLTF